MSMRTWLSRSIGRTREGTKQHLVGTAELLGCGPAVLSAMRQANDEQCEAMLVNHVEKTCGGTADWREHTKDVAETICAFLAPEEAALLQHLSLDDHARPHEAAAQLDKLLAGIERSVVCMAGGPQGGGEGRPGSGRSGQGGIRREQAQQVQLLQLAGPVTA